MRLNYLIALLLVVSAVALSLMLIPKGKELALQNFRDRDFSEAREAYEKRYAAGDRGADTIMPLTRLHIDEGDISGAIRLMEEYVKLDSHQLDGLELLGGLYLSDERMGDYLHNLERIVELRPTADRLFELVSYYGYFGRFEKQIGALERLVAARPDDGDSVQLLAQLLAARGRFDEARTLLAKRDDASAGRLQIDSRDLLTSLLIDAGEVDEAFKRAARWIDADSPTYEIMGLVNLLVDVGRSDLALRLLQPFKERVASDDTLNLTMADLETMSGRPEDARLRLTNMAARGRIPDAVFGRFVGLAVGSGLTQLALEVAEDRALNLIPDWALVGLAESAFGQRDMSFLTRLVTELGDAFLSDRPVLAGEIALARGDAAAARRWAERTLAEKGAPLLDKLTAIRQLRRAGAEVEAVAAFDALPLSGALPDDVLSDLGTLFIDLDRAEAGFRWFADRRRRLPSPAADIGWARLCARAGDPDAVIAWLRSTPTVEGWILDDIAQAAAARGEKAAGLALVAAERAYALNATPATTTTLADAYLVNGRFAEALALIEPLLRNGGPVVEYIYTTALQALGRFEELSAFLTAKLATGLMDEKEADGVLYTLLANKSYAAVLPYVRERAEKRGGEWLYAYAEAARAVGGEAVDRLADFLEREIARADLDDTGRENRVFLLMEAAPERAADTLVALAEANPARWWPTAVESLRQVGPTDRLVAFLEGLIDRTDVTPANRESMAYALIDAAGDERALPVIARLANEVGGGWDAIYRETLTRLGRRDELMAYLIARAARPELPVEEKRATAFALLEMGDKPAAVAVLRELAGGEGPDGADVNQLYYLWGPRPGSEAMNWMAERARAAPTVTAKAAWYAKMVELGAAERVLSAITPAGKADKRGAEEALPVETAYLLPYAEAKAAIKDADGVARAVRAAAASEGDPERLRRLARLAEGAARPDAAGVAWTALLKRRPEDPDALRQVGMLAFDETKLARAAELLRRYVGRKPDDYEAYYFLGEALVAINRVGEARPFFETALRQLRASKGLPRAARQTEAGILNRLGRVDEAVAVYRDLLRENPRDRRVRADFANLLIDHRRLEEARNVLAAR